MDGNSFLALDSTILASTCFVLTVFCIYVLISYFSMDYCLQIKAFNQSINQSIKQMLYTLIFAGTMPGTVLFGAILDYSCALWERRCEGDGSCLYYDNHSMAMYMLYVTTLEKTLSAVFCFLSWRMYNPKAKMGIQTEKSDVSLQEVKN